MPTLHFKIENPCHAFKSNYESDSSRFTCTGSCGHEVFTIISSDRNYDGFGVAAHIRINKRAPRIEVIGATALQARSPADKDRDVINVWLPDSEVEQPEFEISLSLPSDAFERLVTLDWNANEVILYVSNEARGQAITYGECPDGSDIKWDANIAKYVFLDSISLHFMPQKKINARFYEKSVAISGDIHNVIPLIERVLHSVERLSDTIRHCRRGVIRAAWGIAAVVIVMSFVA